MRILSHTSTPQAKFRIPDPKPLALNLTPCTVNRVCRYYYNKQTKEVRWEPPAVEGWRLKKGSGEHQPYFGCRWYAKTKTQTPRPWNLHCWSQSCQTCYTPRAKLSAVKSDEDGLLSKRQKHLKGIVKHIGCEMMKCWKGTVNHIVIALNKTNKHTFTRSRYVCPD